jgi:hypothetical protein
MVTWRIRLLICGVACLGVHNAWAGPCTLATPPVAENRSLSTGLARIERGVFQPLSKTFSGTAEAGASTTAKLRFDASIQRSLQTLATTNRDLANLSDSDRSRLLVDPLRTHPPKIRVAPVTTLAWEPGIVRSTEQRTTPYYTVGDNGTRPLPGQAPQQPERKPALCGKETGRPDDPSCFFSIPPLLLGAADPSQVNNRRMAIADLSTVLLLVRSTDGRSQVCTGSHLGGGVILSAHHCHRTGSFEAADYQVLANTNAIDAPWPQGIAARALNADDPQAASMDFIFLKMETVPQQLAGAFLKLSGRDPWTSCEDGADLEAFLAWHDSDSKFTKRYSADSQCVTKRAAVCYGKDRARVHACDTSESSSGAPILLRGGNSVVAVHTNGRIEDDSNCAVPTAEIKKVLFDAASPKFPEAAAIVWED